MKPVLGKIADLMGISRTSLLGRVLRRIRDRIYVDYTEEIAAIRQSGLFDEAFYRSMYPDLQPVPADPIRHYCQYGWREGRDPSNDFDTRFYLATNTDICKGGINPFWHYITAGASELRHPAADSVTRYEDDIEFGAIETDIKMLAFYASPDWSGFRGGPAGSKGHRQAQLPHADLGFYDLSDGQRLKQQAQLAQRHGLYGFCFELGRDGFADLVSRPMEVFLAHDDIAFRFCVQIELCAGSVSASLVAAIVRALSDDRCIRLEGRPLMLVTLPNAGQGAAAALNELQSRLAAQGIDDVFLIGRLAVTGIAPFSQSLSALAKLCDGVVDLPGESIPVEIGRFAPLDKNGIDAVPYRVVATQGMARARSAQGSARPTFHCITLGRNNTARNAARPMVYTRFSIGEYRRWLDAAIAGARAALAEDRRFIFLNSWNNWQDGLLIEPERQGGYVRVNETSRALCGITSGLACPKVSVIVPNFNHAPFLERRLSSIYGQTYKNIEVILLDDCSSDQSRAVLDHYAALYPQVTRVIYNDVNSGGAFRQWARGIKAASGDLVWVAESDDFCDAQFLEVLVREFDDESVLLAYAKCVFVDRDEVPIQDALTAYYSDLACPEKWNSSYVETAHNEVRSALGIKNTIPNASGVVFRRPIDLPLLDDHSWLSMAVAGDWVFYLHLIRGGKVAYSTETTNYFRRYQGSAAEVTYKKDIFYREVGRASQTVAALYDVPPSVLEQCQATFKVLYEFNLGNSEQEFSRWYDYPAVLRSREQRLPNLMVSTMGFYPGGAEILPIRLANEFKRQGLSVLLLSAGFNSREDGVRRMLRNDVPVVETGDVQQMKVIIHDFGVEALNSHQWHIQKYPLQVADVFVELHAHVASLHGMIEHGNAFAVTEKELRAADCAVSTWVYTAEKNLVPFSALGLYDRSSPRFVKIPNGMQPPRIVPIPRADIGIPHDAFVLCCVSRAIPDKGWAETIQIVERARALSGRDIRLILVGNGPVYDDFRRVGAPDFVYLAGFSANSVGHYAASDMGVMLTTFKSESFPLTIVDCLFAGKPYLASDVGDIRNMLTSSSGIAGEVIELDDWEVPIEHTAQAVAAFATDRKKYSRALSLVPEVANRYHIDVVAAQYVRLFSQHQRENWQRVSEGQY